jgi:chaperonin GroEL
MVIIKSGEEARETILKGIKIVSHTVASTLGPKGKNVIILKNGYYPHSTKDGVTVANAITFTDYNLNLGAMMIRQVADKTAKDVGDGTTTTTVLAYNLLVRAFAFIKAGVSRKELSDQIQKLEDEVVAEILNNSVPVNNDKVLYSVAKISSNGNDEISGNIVKAYGLAGKNGIITVKESEIPMTTIKHVDGYLLSSGYASNHAINNLEKMCVEFHDAKILLSCDRMTVDVATRLMHSRVLDAFTPIRTADGEDLESDNKLIIIADEFENGVIAGFSQYKNIVPIMASGFGDLRFERIYDVAAVTNAYVIDEKKNNGPEGVTFEKLGNVKGISVFKDRTIISSSEENKDLVSRRIQEIENTLKNTDFPFLISQMQERIAVLSGGVVEILVGGSTEIEIKEKKDLYDDAVLACKAAKKGGVVPGGGCALAYARKNIKEESLIFRDVLMSPFETISKNCEVDIVPYLRKATSVYDFVNEKDEDDFISAGIVDPTEVVIACIKNSFSLAKTVLLTESIILPEN